MRRYHAEDDLLRSPSNGDDIGPLPIMLTEFGGIAVGDVCAGQWGYSRCETPEQFAEHYRRLLEVVRSSELLAGFCYTQLYDTYQEINGLLGFDRRPKLPLEQIAQATRGSR